MREGQWRRQQKRWRVFFFLFLQLYTHFIHATRQQIRTSQGQKEDIQTTKKAIETLAGLAIEAFVRWKGAKHGLPHHEERRDSAFIPRLVPVRIDTHTLHRHSLCVGPLLVQAGAAAAEGTVASIVLFLRSKRRACCRHDVCLRRPTGPLRLPLPGRKPAGLPFPQARLCIGTFSLLDFPLCWDLAERKKPAFRLWWERVLVGES